MRLEPRVVNRLHARVLFESARDGHRVGALLLDPAGERADPAKDEPRVEGRRDGAEDVADVLRLFEELAALAEGDRAALDVAVASEVLGRRVHDGVGAELE